MTRSQWINVINNCTSNSDKIIQLYCLDKGKTPKDIDLFIFCCKVNMILDDIIDYTYDTICREHSLIEIRDKHGNFIKVY